LEQVELSPEKVQTDITKVSAKAKLVNQRSQNKPRKTDEEEAKQELQS